MGECVKMHLKKACLQVNSNNFGLGQLSTIIKRFITKALQYKAVLKFKK